MNRNYSNNNDSSEYDLLEAHRDFAVTYSNMKRVNIQLDDDIHTKAKIISLLKNTTLNDYLSRAVTDAISKDKKVLEKVPKA